jgi:hypothetical protein
MVDHLVLETFEDDAPLVEIADDESNMVLREERHNFLLAAE